MAIHFVGSEKLKSKLGHVLNEDFISDVDIHLVEKGYERPGEGIVIEFDSLDYDWILKLIMNTFNKEDNDYIIGFKNNTYRRIHYKEVYYLEASKNGLMAYTSEGKMIFKETLATYESHFEKHGFIRINKSQVVNMAHVVEIIPWFNSRYVLKLSTKSELEVSKLYAKMMRKSLNI
jgi:two-component system response regulator LytT